jgi:ABC-type lipoprotein export system ATPase subunit/ABC-type antimicrobial peptide transport system permease subunit
VTNGVSLTLEEKGLVVILGASGSGKTTLLHLIGGMDRFDSGAITIGSDKITSFRPRQWDRLHQKKIAYVFQSHQLLSDRTVLFNLSLALRLRGVKTKEDLAKEAKSLLDAVGLTDYEDRLVRQLSGGQQQRVAVARGLAIGPDVLLADEPTGNLDSKNAFELLRLFRVIARDRLVVMVTHNADLAERFADRILEIENGSIVRDRLPKKRDQNEEELEHQIQLDRYRKASIVEGTLRIDRYESAIQSSDLSVDLIERHQTVYVRVKAGNAKRVKLLSEDSGVEILSGQDHVGIERPLPFAFENNDSGKKPRAFRFIELWRMAWENLAFLAKQANRWIAVLALVGVIVAVSIGLIGEANAVNIPVAAIDPHYIGIEFRRSGIEVLDQLAAIEGVDQVMVFSGARSFTLSTEAFFQVRTTVEIKAVPIDIRFLRADSLLEGSMSDTYGIVIDKSVADDLIAQHKNRGIETYQDVLNCRFTIQASGDAINLSPDRKLSFPITGIANNQSNSVWMAEELIYSLITPSLVDYRVLGDGFEILEGGIPISETYILLNDQYPALYNGEVPQMVGFGTGNYYISGVYRYAVEGRTYNFNHVMVSTLPYMRTRLFRFQNGTKIDFELMVYAEDIETAIVNLTEAGYRVVDHRFDLELARQMKWSEYANLYMLGLVGIAICGLCVSIIVRSQLIERRYEIGVYRGIGISRGEIVSMFLVEAMVVAAVSSLLAYLLTIALLEWAGMSFERLSVTQYSIVSVLFGCAGLAGIHGLFSVLPVAILLRKTPAELMKQSDL